MGGLVWFGLVFALFCFSITQILEMVPGLWVQSCPWERGFSTLPFCQLTFCPCFDGFKMALEFLDSLCVFRLNEVITGSASYVFLSVVSVREQRLSPETSSLSYFCQISVMELPLVTHEDRERSIW